jgi:hypothetical protein
MYIINVNTFPHRENILKRDIVFAKMSKNVHVVLSSDAEWLRFDVLLTLKQKSFYLPCRHTIPGLAMTEGQLTQPS